MMDDPMDGLPDVSFGEAGAKPKIDWRKSPELEDERDDDEELAETPPDVVALLGFDPLDDEDFATDVPLAGA
jgi:hypothetical protein